MKDALQAIAFLLLLVAALALMGALDKFLPM